MEKSAKDRSSAPKTSPVDRSEVEEHFRTIDVTNRSDGGVETRTKEHNQITLEESRTTETTRKATHEEMLAIMNAQFYGYDEFQLEKEINTKNIEKSEKEHNISGVPVDPEGKKVIKSEQYRQEQIIEGPRIGDVTEPFPGTSKTEKTTFHKNIVIEDEESQKLKANIELHTNKLKTDESSPLPIYENVSALNSLHRIRHKRHVLEEIVLEDVDTFYEDKGKKRLSFPKSLATDTPTKTINSKENLITDETLFTENNAKRIKVESETKHSKKEVKLPNKAQSESFTVNSDLTFINVTDTASNQLKFKEKNVQELEKKEDKKKDKSLFKTDRVPNESVTFIITDPFEREYELSKNKEIHELESKDKKKTKENLKLKEHLKIDETKTFVINYDNINGQDSIGKPIGIDKSQYLVEHNLKKNNNALNPKQFESQVTQISYIVDHDISPIGSPVNITIPEKVIAKNNEKKNKQIELPSISPLDSSFKVIQPATKFEDTNIVYKVDYDDYLTKNEKVEIKTKPGIFAKKRKYDVQGPSQEDNLDQLTYVVNYDDISNSKKTTTKHKLPKKYDDIDINELTYVINYDNDPYTKIQLDNKKDDKMIINKSHLKENLDFGKTSRKFLSRDIIDDLPTVVTENNPSSQKELYLDESTNVIYEESKYKSKHDSFKAKPLVLDVKSKAKPGEIYIDEDIQVFADMGKDKKYKIPKSKAEIDIGKFYDYDKDMDTKTFIIDHEDLVKSKQPDFNTVREGFSYNQDFRMKDNIKIPKNKMDSRNYNVNYDDKKVVEPINKKKLKIDADLMKLHRTDDPDYDASIDINRTYVIEHENIIKPPSQFNEKSGKKQKKQKLSSSTSNDLSKTFIIEYKDEMQSPPLEDEQNPLNFKTFIVQHDDFENSLPKSKKNKTQTTSEVKQYSEDNSVFTVVEDNPRKSLIMSSPHGQAELICSDDLDMPTSQISLARQDEKVLDKSTFKIEQDLPQKKLNIVDMTNQYVNNVTYVVQHDEIEDIFNEKSHRKADKAKIKISKDKNKVKSLPINDESITFVINENQEQKSITKSSEHTDKTSLKIPKLKQAEEIISDETDIVISQGQKPKVSKTQIRPEAKKDDETLEYIVSYEMPSTISKDSAHLKKKKDGSLQKLQKEKVIDESLDIIENTVKTKSDISSNDSMFTFIVNQPDIKPESNKSQLSLEADKSKQMEEILNDSDDIVEENESSKKYKVKSKTPKLENITNRPDEDYTITFISNENDHDTKKKSMHKDKKKQTQIEEFDCKKLKISEENDSNKPIKPKNQNKSSDINKLQNDSIITFIVNQDDDVFIKNTDSEVKDKKKLDSKIQIKQNEQIVIENLNVSEEYNSMKKNKNTLSINKTTLPDSTVTYVVNEDNTQHPKHLLDNRKQAEQIVDNQVSITETQENIKSHKNKLKSTKKSITDTSPTEDSSITFIVNEEITDFNNKTKSKKHTTVPEKTKQTENVLHDKFNYVEEYDTSKESIKKLKDFSQEDLNVTFIVNNDDTIIDLPKSKNVENVNLKPIHLKQSEKIMNESYNVVEEYNSLSKIKINTKKSSIDKEPGMPIEDSTLTFIINQDVELNNLTDTAVSVTSNKQLEKIVNNEFVVSEENEKTNHKQMKIKTPTEDTTMKFIVNDTDFKDSSKITTDLEHSSNLKKKQNEKYINDHINISEQINVSKEKNKNKSVNKSNIKTPTDDQTLTFIINENEKEALSLAPKVAKLSKDNNKQTEEFIDENIKITENYDSLIKNKSKNLKLNKHQKVKSNKEDTTMTFIVNKNDETEKLNIPIANEKQNERVINENINVTEEYDSILKLKNKDKNSKLNIKLPKDDETFTFIVNNKDSSTSEILSSNTLKKQKELCIDEKIDISEEFKTGTDQLNNVDLIKLSTNNKNSEDTSLTFVVNDQSLILDKDQKKLIKTEKPKIDKTKQVEKVVNQDMNITEEYDRVKHFKNKSKDIDKKSNEITTTTFIVNTEEDLPKPTNIVGSINVSTNAKKHKQAEQVINEQINISENINESKNEKLKGSASELLNHQTHEDSTFTFVVKDDNVNDSLIKTKKMYPKQKPLRMTDTLEFVTSYDMPSNITHNLTDKESALSEIKTKDEELIFITSHEDSKVELPKIKADKLKQPAEFITDSVVIVDKKKKTKMGKEKVICINPEAKDEAITYIVNDDTKLSSLPRQVGDQPTEYIKQDETLSFIISHYEVPTEPKVQFEKKKQAEVIKDIFTVVENKSLPKKSHKIKTNKSTIDNQSKDETVTFIINDKENLASNIKMPLIENTSLKNTNLKDETLEYLVSHDDLPSAKVSKKIITDKKNKQNEQIIDDLQTITVTQDTKKKKKLKQKTLGSDEKLEFIVDHNQKHNLEKKEFKHDSTVKIVIDDADILDKENISKGTKNADTSMTFVVNEPVINLDQNINKSKMQTQDQSMTIITNYDDIHYIESHDKKVKTKHINVPNIVSDDHQKTTNVSQIKPDENVTFEVKYENISDLFPNKNILNKNNIKQESDQEVTYIIDRDTSYESASLTHKKLPTKLDTVVNYENVVEINKKQKPKINLTNDGQEIDILIAKDQKTILVENDKVKKKIKIENLKSDENINYVVNYENVPSNYHKKDHSHKNKDANREKKSDDILKELVHTDDTLTYIVNTPEETTRVKSTADRSSKSALDKNQFKTQADDETVTFVVNYDDIEKENSVPNLTKSKKPQTEVHMLKKDKKLIIEENGIDLMTSGATDGLKLAKQIAVVKPEVNMTHKRVSHTLLYPLSDPILEHSMSEDFLPFDRKTSASTPESIYIKKSKPIHKTKNSPYLVIVAVDIGTTFSGYAFSFMGDQTNSVHVMRKWEGGDPGAHDHKTPSILLQTPEGEFHSFGFTARDFFHDLSPKEAKRWLYFDKFKLPVCEGKDLNMQTELSAVNGTKCSAVDIFAQTLYFFKHHAIQEIADQLADNITNDDIQWIVTVPAVWKGEAVDFMRAAAYWAGLASPKQPDQLMIITEAEAASLHVRKQRLHQLLPESPLFRRRRYSNHHRSLTPEPTINKPLTYDSISIDASTQWVSPSSISLWRPISSNVPHTNITVGHQVDTSGTRYMLVDCGGGTVDLTIHEVESRDGKVREVYKTTGGAFGSTIVDLQFEELLVGIFGQSFIDVFKQKRPAGWVDLIMAFESRKRAANPYDVKPLNVSLPFSFIDYYKKIRNDTVENAVHRYGDKTVRWTSQGMLRLMPEAMDRLFQSALSQIKHAIHHVLQDSSNDGIKYLFLVGGFGESPMLQKTMRKEFSHLFKIIIPYDASTAVLKGAVSFGLDPSAVDTLTSSFSYGLASVSAFDTQIHPSAKRMPFEDKDLCIDLFDPLIRAGESIAVGDTVVRQYAILSEGEGRQIDIYRSKKSGPRFVSEEGVSLIGSILMPGNLRGRRDSQIEVRATFNEKIVDVNALDVHTGFLAQSSFDFQHK